MAGPVQKLANHSSKVSKKAPHDIVTTHWFYLKRDKAVVDYGKEAEQRRCCVFMVEVHQAYLQKQKKKAGRSSWAQEQRAREQSTRAQLHAKQWACDLSTKETQFDKKNQPHQQSGPLDRADPCLFVHLCSGLLAAFYNHFICPVNWIIINGSVCESVAQVTGSAVTGDILKQPSNHKLCEEMSHLAS